MALGYWAESAPSHLEGECPVGLGLCCRLSCRGGLDRCRLTAWRLFTRRSLFPSTTACACQSDTRTLKGSDLTLQSSDLFNTGRVTHFVSGGRDVTI